MKKFKFRKTNASIIAYKCSENLVEVSSLNLSEN